MAEPHVVSALRRSGRAGGRDRADDARASAAPGSAIDLGRYAVPIRPGRRAGSHRAEGMAPQGRLGEARGDDATVPGRTAPSREQIR
jgi:hypothetical protein